MDLLRSVAYEICDKHHLTPLEISQAGVNFPISRLCERIIGIIEPLSSEAIGKIASESPAGRRWLDLGVLYSQNETGIIPTNQTPEELGRIAFLGRGKYHALVGASISLFGVMHERIAFKTTSVVHAEEKLARDLV